MRGLIGCMVILSGLLSGQANAYTLSPDWPLNGTLSTAFGTFVDHPDLIVPSSAICNKYAEEHMAFLNGEGVDAFYITALVPENDPPYLISHVVVGFNQNGQTFIWDNAAVFKASDLHRAYGYIWTGIEVNDSWYSVKAN